MNTGQRIAILVVAVIVLAGGFVLARGSDDESAEQTRTPAETVASDPTETSEGTGGAEAPSTTPDETPTQTQEAPPAPRVETVRIRDNQPVGEPRTVSFEDGDTIRLRFRSNVASEVHIHGYDKYVNVPAGGSARTSFKANAQGVFEMEDHGTGALLAKLEVRP